MSITEREKLRAFLISTDRDACSRYLGNISLGSDLRCTITERDNLIRNEARSGKRSVTLKYLILL